MTSPVAPTSAAAGAADPTSSTDAANGLGADAFLQLLVAQMKYQDPSSPTDGTQFMTQLAQFTQVQSLQSISTTMTSALNWQQTVAGEGMLGDTVTGADVNGKAATGVVDAVSPTSTGALLTLADGTQMDVSSVTGVTNLTTNPTATSTTS
jgi:flagellar basal-body rod modification protein FlgD